MDGHAPSESKSESSPLEIHLQAVDGLGPYLGIRAGSEPPPSIEHAGRTWIWAGQLRRGWWTWLDLYRPAPEPPKTSANDAILVLGAMAFAELRRRIAEDAASVLTASGPVPIRFDVAPTLARLMIRTTPWSEGNGHDG